MSCFFYLEGKGPQRNMDKGAAFATVASQVARWTWVNGSIDMFELSSNRGRAASVS